MSITSDLWALIATLGLAIFQIGLQSILVLRQAGPAWVAGPRDEPKVITGMAGRMARAHKNLIDIFPQFLAALFLVHVTGFNDQLAVIGAWMFFVSRFLYVPAYAWAPPGIRSVFWQGGQIGIIVIVCDLFW